MLSAQTSDSIKAIVKLPVAEYFPEKDFFPNSCSYKSIDTSLDGIQKYYPHNFPYSLGLSNRKLLFEPSLEIGFRNGFESLDLFGYNKNKIKYYRTRTPYTEIFALFGMKKEQFARLLHTQNITKQWNIALNMLRLRSEGFYNRQNCTDNNISLSSNYTSKNNRYSFLANGIMNSIKTDENGGVQDYIFENNLLANKKLIPVNLLNARTRRGNREFSLMQFLNFGKKDSVKGDSTMRYRIYPKSSFSYSFNAHDSWFVYDDKNPISGYYQNIFNDSSETLDSTYIMEFQNEISYNYLSQKNKFGEKFSLSIRNQNVTVKENNFDSVYSNLFATASLHTSYLSFKTNYCFLGQNMNDFLVSLHGKLSPGKNSVLEINVNTSETTPTYFHSRYSSNHFNWVTDFEKMFFASGDIKYSDSKHKFSLSASLSKIDNYIFLDVRTPFLSGLSNYTPFPNQGDAVIYSAQAEKYFQLKKFHFNNKIIWQQATEDVIHLPQFITNHSLYYQAKWFKKAVDVQIGFDVTYFTSYYADAYMSAIGQYYLQDEKKIGNYPFIDFFFNMKVKHAKIFFKTEHVNSGLMGAYYLAPHIPAPDRSIKVGINWMFYN